MTQIGKKKKLGKQILRFAQDDIQNNNKKPTAQKACRGYASDCKEQ